MRIRTFLLGSTLLASAVLAACAGEEGASVEDATEQDLTVLELTCKAPGTTFTVEPGFGGTVYEGKLTEGDASSTLFVCKLAGADAGAPDGGAGAPVATCVERPQTIHPGRYTAVVTKTGATYAASLSRGVDGGAPLALACATPARPDAGTADAQVEAAAPVPTYAEVKPIIDGTCGHCHTGVFGSLANVKQRRVQMLSAITSGAMPRGASDWKSTPNGQKLIDFLRNSPEL